MVTIRSGPGDAVPESGYRPSLFIWEGTCGEPGAVILPNATGIRLEAIWGSPTATAGVAARVAGKHQVEGWGRRLGDLPEV